MTEPEDWNAESDLNALQQAKAIKDDPSRLDRAREFASRKAEELKAAAGDIPKAKPKSKFSGARRS